MTAKDCGNHGKDRRMRLRRACACLLVFNFILLLTILLVWAILQPTKPKFILQDATVYAFNVTPNLLTSSFQVTLSSRNPNDKVGVYYDKLDVYAVYRNQQITLRTQIPPTYQGHKDINVWSPYIYGNSVPVSPYNADALAQDQSSGTVMLLIKADGRVRWKVGTFITGRYHFYVRCPAYITFGSRSTGIVVGNNAVKYQLVQQCSVSV
ncbi:NDR1/HIN1-like protein 1 [Quercus lobata]|uniref:Late embryogenesis abundant protein LEA-2 subgroup domain-containing protein n=1 Tax=Quercus lobata TaxID=97700 RepID=A0A7N2M5R3_QUELO|nr:NDR1/HIN1-like protein 1 [Quercus lobata]